eukprot:s418_g5.t1
MTAMSKKFPKITELKKRCLARWSLQLNDSMWPDTVIRSAARFAEFEWPDQSVGAGVPTASWSSLPAFWISSPTSSLTNWTNCRRSQSCVGIEASPTAPESLPVGFTLLLGLRLWEQHQSCPLKHRPCVVLGHCAMQLDARLDEKLATFTHRQGAAEQIRDVFFPPSS